MKINSIKVGGFKNLSLTKLELEKICALISPNNFGKSNLMEAIDFGLDFIHASRNGRKNMMGWIKGIPLCSVLEEREYYFEIEFEGNTSMFDMDLPFCGIEMIRQVTVSRMNG